MLAGCGSSAPEKNARYKHVTDLRDAYVAAGGHCDQWKQIYNTAFTGRPESVNVLEQGDCNTKEPGAYGALLTIYANREDAIKEADAIRWGESLVGPNWHIMVGNGDDIPALAKKLGGVYDTENYNQ